MNSRNRIGSILWGAAFILVGIGIAGNAMNWWNFELFFNGWWTLFIIVPCAIAIIQNGPHAGSMIGLIIGIMLLLMQQNIIEWSTVGDLLVPVILVIIGLGFILRSNKRPEQYFENEGGFCDCSGFNSTAADGTDTSGANTTDGHYSSGNGKDISAIFGSRKVTYQNEEFTGATMNAIFGGACLDLRSAVMNGNIEINATAVFGGIDIMVPANVRVLVNSVPIFGGVSNKAMNPVGDIGAVIHLNATCMFGGIDIK